MNETELFDANEIINRKANLIMPFHLGILHSFLFSGKKKQQYNMGSILIMLLTTLAGIIY